jgi:hypothetical protein
LLSRSSGSQQGPGNVGLVYFCHQHVAVPLQRDVAEQLADLRPRPDDVVAGEAAQVRGQRPKLLQYPRQQLDDVAGVDRRGCGLQRGQLLFRTGQPIRERGRRPQQPGRNRIGQIGDLRLQFATPRSPPSPPRS